MDITVSFIFFFSFFIFVFLLATYIFNCNSFPLFFCVCNENTIPTTNHFCVYSQLLIFISWLTRDLSIIQSYSSLCNVHWDLVVEFNKNSYNLVRPQISLIYQDCDVVNGNKTFESNPYTSKETFLFFIVNIL